MKTSPKIHSGPFGGGISIPINPLRQTVFPNCVTFNKKKKKRILFYYIKIKIFHNLNELKIKLKYIYFTFKT